MASKGELSACPFDDTTRIIIKIHFVVTGDIRVNVRHPDVSKDNILHNN